MRMLFLKNASHRYKLLLFILPLAAGVPFLRDIFKEDMIIYPGFRSNIGIATDKTHRNGNTVTHLFQVSEDSVKFAVTLYVGDDNSFPYAFVYFSQAADSYKYFDLSEYDYVEVEVEAEVENGRAITVPVYIRVEIPNYSHTGDYETYRIMANSIKYSKEQRKYRLYIKQFKTPPWWWENNPTLKEFDAGEPNYSRATEIHISASDILTLGVKEQVTIYKISVGKSVSWATLTISIFTVVFCYGALFLVTKVRRYKRSVVLPYEKQLNNTTGEEINNLIAYISKNYQNPDLSVENVQKEVGMSERKMSALLRSSLDTTFKKYLNQIRLQAACRLLLETSKPIKEIAYLVGYSNITHFNRIFKEMVNCSPNEYRKNGGSA